MNDTTPMYRQRRMNIIFYIDKVTVTTAPFICFLFFFFLAIQLWQIGNTHSKYNLDGTIFSFIIFPEKTKVSFSNFVQIPFKLFSFLSPNITQLSIQLEYIPCN